MATSPSSMNNKNNSSSKVNVNVAPSSAPQNNPFPGAGHQHDEPYGYSPPDFMKQVISSILTFKDDIPNLLRKIAYTLIAFLVISNCVTLGFVYSSFNDMREEIRENRAKISSVYNKQREIVKALSTSPVNPNLTE